MSERAASRPLSLSGVVVNAVKAYSGTGPILEAWDRDIVRRMLRRDSA